MNLIDGTNLTCDTLHRIAHGEPCSIANSSLCKMEQNALHTPSAILESKRAWLLGEEQEHSENLKKEFILGHCAGVGELLPKSYVRAAMAARANVLASGFTGSRPIAAEKLIELINSNNIPDVPAQGSVGAAGDLALREARHR